MKNQHLVLQLEKIKNVECLKHLSILQEIMDKILDALKVTIVNKAGHQFKPFGATMVYVLAESHCTCHTFWEEQEAYIDLFCCSEFDHDLAIKLFVEAFQAGEYDYNILSRSNQVVDQEERN
jgi:S-adenosylmethionine decarboxylase proenzyme